MLYSDKVEKFIPPRKGKKHALKLILDMLYFKPESKKTNISETLRFASNIIKGWRFPSPAWNALATGKLYFLDKWGMKPKSAYFKVFNTTRVYKFDKHVINQVYILSFKIQENIFTSKSCMQFIIGLLINLTVVLWPFYTSLNYKTFSHTISIRHHFCITNLYIKHFGSLGGSKHSIIYIQHFSSLRARNFQF